MSTRKKEWRERPRPDLYSEKSEGKINQTLRLDPDQNTLIREASKLEGLSINTWAVRILVRSAAAKVAAHKPTPRKKATLG